ncbi:TPA: pilin [Photobacterium damselae]
MKGQKGFTLIELMIVVAIIGVLSAVAIPAYKNYVSKSEASSALATLKALVTPAELYIQENGALTTTITDIGTTANANPLGTLAINGDADGDNTITFTFDQEKSSLEGATLVLTRNTDNGWACTTTAPTSGSMPELDSCAAPETGENSESGTK